MLYDPNELRARSEATKRSAPRLKDKGGINMAEEEIKTQQEFYLQVMY